MKSYSISLFFLVLCTFAAQTTYAQIEEHELDLLEETATVTFECNSCSGNNKISIVGSEKFKFKNVSFPFNQEMKLGDYKITYWQNGVQQSYLPFQINKDSNNTIEVDSGPGF